jgi:DNA-binding NtrC family response regulator
MPPRKPPPAAARNLEKRIRRAIREFEQTLVSDVRRATDKFERTLLKEIFGWFEHHKAERATKPVANKTQPLNLQAVEKRTIAAALLATDGNVTRTATLLGISRATLHRKVQEYERGARDRSAARPKSRRPR